MRKVLSPPDVLKGWQATGRGMLLRLRRFVEDRRGVGAIEFAIVAPLLMMAYVSAFEVTVAITASRKVSRASATISDLLTQSNTTNKATLDTMKNVVAKIVAPFPVNSAYTLKITGVAVAADGKATVAWSRDQAGNAPYAKNSVVTLPSDMGNMETFIVRTELSVPYSILLLAPNLDSNLNKIKLGRTSYFRLRVGKKIDCSDC
ncbi:TadE/TadG family type IV pilus assembly protein [Shinella sp. HZN7]|uniref:TadE/TadG family type IV pilus assembly protein n=1 Tax=Shinella sp. (strain HZN7) TaxID=879274 RepID=UPI000ACCD0A4|nr:TadE/TadG family type IV pilus assembly protein [Shinella sp. HZN7]